MKNVIVLVIFVMWYAKILWNESFHLEAIDRRYESPVIKSGTNVDENLLVLGGLKLDQW